MAIADFNRNNPFVIMCRYKSEELKNQMLNMTKEHLYTGVTISVTLILLISECIIYCRYTYWFLLVGLILLIWYLLSIRMLKKIINDSVYHEINSILYGNEYNIINVDNERLMDILLKADFILGRIYQQKMMIKYTRYCILALLMLIMILSILL